MEGEVLPPVSSTPQETETQYAEVGFPLAFPIDTGKKVYQLARWGARPPAICKHIDHPLTGKPIDEKTLMDYFATEVKEGTRDGAQETLRSLHEQVTGEGGVKRNVQAAIFRSQQQVDMIGFTNTQEVKHTIVENQQLRQKIESLDEQDILQLRAILAKRVESGDAASRTARLRGRKSRPKTDGEDAK